MLLREMEYNWFAVVIISPYMQILSSALLFNQKLGIQLEDATGLSQKKMPCRAGLENERSRKRGASQGKEVKRRRSLVKKLKRFSSRYVAIRKYEEKIIVE